MKRAAILVLLLAGSAFAADPFEGLKRLDRIVVTDQDGDATRGVVRSIVRGRLALQVEAREGLTGTLVFERKSVSKVEKTGTATEEELKALSEPPPSLEGLVEPEEKPEAVEPPPDPPRPVLEAFPPGAWSLKRRDEIAAKDAFLRTAEEREFLERYDEWVEALESAARWAKRRLDEFFPEDDESQEATYDRLRHVPAVIGRELDPNELDWVAAYEAWLKARADLAAAR
ncbi:MAG: hypothetical protein IT452_13485 [Planctomycetia bacterium]|nr:hypothetical protein [Planctomycetia bacterium]